MIRPSVLAIAAALALSGGLAACTDRPATDVTAPRIPDDIQYVADAHSYARPEIARVYNVALDLTADFERRILSGTATLDITAEEGATEIILDIRDLDIRAVRSDDGPLTYVIGDEQPFLGRPLTITIPFTEGRIHIDYATRPDAAALQWLSPEQTAGGAHPFLFSQGQAILTRTWIPTQDSPGIRQTYSARIVVPEGLKAVMSAEMLTPDGEAVDGGRAFRFRLDQPVPPYLIALAAGDLAFQSLGERTGVWTEPSMLERSAAEFTEVEAMVEAAEALYGPYIWGRYDLLVLPPSFPFGGMENPRLTFATPTIIAGDRSLVSLVAHELAHSWSGNLVTNATWDDFWLNEGFTVYFENRIMEAIYGAERAEMLRSLEWTELQPELAGLPAADQHLHLDLDGRDPDEGMTSIAYDKGALFLRTIEGIVGRDRFDGWLRSYFQRNAYRPMTTALFLADLREHLIAGDRALEAELQLDAWINGPGLPSNAVQPSPAAFAPVEAQAQAFAGGAVASSLDTDGWVTQQWQHFLGSLPQDMSAAQLADLDRAFGLSQAGNSEIRFAWLMIAVKHRYQPAVPSLEQFLTSMGRRKFTQPLYVALMAEGDWGRPIARRIYERARPGYHPITTGSADPVVRGR